MDKSSMDAVASMIKAYNADLVAMGSPNCFFTKDGVLYFQENATKEWKDQCYVWEVSFDAARLFLMRWLIQEYRTHTR